MGLWSGHEHLVFSQTYVAIQLISSDELVWMSISMMKETVGCERWYLPRPSQVEQEGELARWAAPWVLEEGEQEGELAG